MSKEFVNFLITFLFPLFMLGQARPASCSRIKNGTFYFYQANTQNEFIIVREGCIQKEINYKTNDTSFWKVNWQSNCILNLKFIRKSQPITNEEKIFLNSHSTIVKVLNVGKYYYTFKGGLDSVSNTRALTDTLWFKAR